MDVLRHEEGLRVPEDIALWDDNIRLQAGLAMI